MCTAIKLFGQIKLRKRFRRAPIATKSKSVAGEKLRILRTQLERSPKRFDSGAAKSRTATKIIRRAEAKTLPAVITTHKRQRARGGIADPLCF